MVAAPDPLGGDTIAAISTAPGRGAVALVRVSGADAGRILLRIAPGLRGVLPPSRRQHLLHLVHPESGEPIDRALVTVFPAPASFTGEDTVEISTHGGYLSPQLVLAAVCAAGARPAGAGDFTRRALDNGKLDLTQAESILDLIDGSSPAMHRAAIHQLEGGLSRRIVELRRAILKSEALLAYGIDFPEEDEPPVPPANIVRAVEDCLVQIGQFLRNAPQGMMLREGALVVLAGYPNSGKSSLFNALLGVERSIVTEVPGTTRDAVEAFLNIQGYPFRLVDTAGLRETADRVEGMGVEFARRYLRAADVILYCVEASRSPLQGDMDFLAEHAGVRPILVRTKTDLGPVVPSDRLPAVLDEVSVSSRSGDGLRELGDLLVRRSFGLVLSDAGEAPLITRERHVRALEAAAAHLREFLESMEAGTPMELAATHLRDAASALEEIIGILAPDDVLAAVFSQFCVGK